MRLPINSFAAITIAMILFRTSSVGAQSLWPVSLEASIGDGKSTTSGEYHGHGNGNTLDLVAGLRFKSLFGGGLTAALGIGTHGTGAVADICLPPTTGTGCIPRLPQFTVYSGLLGWETHGSYVRVLAGPAVAHAAGRDQLLVRYDESVLAWVGRVDFATPAIMHISAIAFFRAAHVPEFRGDSFRLQSIGLGLRLR